MAGFVRDQDTKPGLDVRGMTTTERNQIYTLLNWSPTEHFQADRWPLAQAMYESVGSVAQFVVYPGVGPSAFQAPPPPRASFVVIMMTPFSARLP
jgi:hypothetical protein